MAPHNANSMRPVLLVSHVSAKPTSMPRIMANGIEQPRLPVRRVWRGDASVGDGRSAPIRRFDGAGPGRYDKRSGDAAVSRGAQDPPQHQAV